MKINYISDLSDFKTGTQDAAITIGFFDAVHEGHSYLINKLCSSKLKKIIITFEQHPNKNSICTIDEKLNKLSKYNVDQILVIENNVTNLNMSSQGFINFLEKINTKTIFTGIDFRFGHKATGTICDLQEKFNVEIIDFLKYDNEKISSSKIRNLIFTNEFEQVEKELGYKYYIYGVVVHGKEIGRTINFPTANIKTTNTLPSDGVYMTRTYICDRIYLSATNVGKHPTFNDDEKSIETYILDFNEDLYGKNIKVEFVKKIRDIVRFNSVEELKIQIQNDVNKIRGENGN